MDYFSRFHLPQSLDIDLTTLKAEFLKQQQLYHPDKAQNKEAALIQSSEINHAYKTLLTVDSRAGYLLTLKKQDDGLDQSIHDFEFLTSALEIREQLDEANTVEQLKSLRLEISQWMDSLANEFTLEYQAEDWPEAKDTVRKLKFFQRILNDIDQAEDRLFDDENFDLDDDF